MKSRRDAREWALKVLYALDLSGNSLEVVLGQVLPQTIETNHREFLLELVRRTAEHQDWIDDLIREHAEKWEFGRIAVLDRLLLRLAICELYFFPDIPPKVTINEAIEIARKYSTDKSDKFVNGVLDAILQQKLKKTPVIAESEAKI